jgi:hypothetical protein
MTPTFVHEFRSPLAPPCRALAVRHGMNVYVVGIYNGRECYVTNSQRVWGGKGRSYFTAYTVYYLDGSSEIIPAGRFNKGVKPAPLPADVA